jgi:hypothetical protein
MEISDIKVGSIVKCLYGNSGNKFWSKVLSPFCEVEEIIPSGNAPDKLRFKGRTDFFYANDFRLVSIEELRGLAIRNTELLDALKAISNNPHIDLGDLVYTVRDREGEGWAGRYVHEWNDACAKINELLKDIKL